jgi:hypothetical protein
MPEPATSDETSLPDGRGSTPASELVHVSIPVKAMCDAAPGAARPPGPPVSGSLRARRSTLLQHRQRRLPTHTPMGATLHEPARTTACHPPAAMPRTDRVSRPLTLIEAARAPPPTAVPRPGVSPGGSRHLPRMLLPAWPSPPNASRGRKGRYAPRRSWRGRRPANCL